MHFSNVLPKAIVTPKAHIPLETGFASANFRVANAEKCCTNNMKYT